MFIGGKMHRSYVSPMVSKMNPGGQVVMSDAWFQTEIFVAGAGVVAGIYVALATGVVAVVEVVPLSEDK